MRFLWFSSSWLGTTKGDAINLELKANSTLQWRLPGLAVHMGQRRKKPFRATVCDEEGTASCYISLTASLVDALHDLRDSDEVMSKCFWID